MAYARKSGHGKALGSVALTGALAFGLANNLRVRAAEGTAADADWGR